MMNEFPFGYVKNKQGQDSHAIADWKHIDGKPTDLVDKPALDAAIADIQKPDLSGTFLYQQIKPLMDWNDIKNKPTVDSQSVIFAPLNGFTLSVPFSYETVKFGPNAQLITLHGSVKLGGTMKAFSQNTIGMFTGLPKPVTNQYGTVVGSSTASGWGNGFVVTFDSTGTQLIAGTPHGSDKGDEIYINMSFWSEEVTT